MRLLTHSASDLQQKRLIPRSMMFNRKWEFGIRLPILAEECTVEKIFRINPEPSGRLEFLAHLFFQACPPVAKRRRDKRWKWYLAFVTAQLHQQSCCIEFPNVKECDPESFALWAGATGLAQYLPAGRQGIT